MAKQQTRQPILQNQARQALQNSGELTDEQKKAIRAGSARAFYADLPGAFTDIAGTALDYGAEGLARLLPSDLAGYDLPKALGIRGFQRAMRDPALGSKQLERVGEKAGYIPPTTGTQEEEMARLFMGLADPMPLPAGMTSRVFSSPAVKAVSEIKQNKMPANQWISQMKSRGVKQDELTWTGVEDWLKSQKGSVTKDELDLYLDANQIEVQEVILGRPAPSEELFQQSYRDLKDYLQKTYKVDNPQLSWFDDFMLQLREYDIKQGQIVNRQGNPISESDLYSDIIEDTNRDPVLGDLVSDYILNFKGRPPIQDPAKYAEYTLEGGENYRELLLRIPSRVTGFNLYSAFDVIKGVAQKKLTRDETLKILDQMGLQTDKAHQITGKLFAGQRQYDELAEINNFIDQSKPEMREMVGDNRLSDFPKLFPDHPVSKAMARKEQINEQLRETFGKVRSSGAEDLKFEEQQLVERQKKMDFTSSHFDERNIVAHIRFNERVDADGNKVLFIEEIQSDWAQAGRKKGFIPTEAEKIEASNKIKELRKQQQELALKYEETKDPIYNEQWQKIEDQIPALGRLAVVSDTGSTSRVPQAPFVMDTNQWTSLALKRMVRWATDNGFDKIAWTTGKQQAKRYDLSKQVDEISYRKNKDGTYFLLIRPKGSDSALDTIQNQSMKSVPEEKLEDIIGKELAKKMVNKEGEEFANLAVMNDAETQEDMIFRKFTGVDLEVGGEGMGAFYDKILVDRAKKLGKQYGSKVEKGEVDVSSMNNVYKDEIQRQKERLNQLEQSGGLSDLRRRRILITIDSLKNRMADSYEPETAWTMNLTDKLKKAAKDGLPYYVALPPIAAGVQRESERQQINQIQAKQNAQRINAQ